MDTKHQIIDELRTMHNDVCIFADMDIGRLVGFYEDDEDYYYIARSLKRGQGRSTEYKITCAAHYLSLKGRLQPERYEAMDKLLTMNGAGPSEEFIYTAKYKIKKR